LWIKIAVEEIGPFTLVAFRLLFGLAGLLGFCTAYLLFFYLINAWGATRASVVTSVFPVIGLILGLLFLGEVADGRLLLGSLLVVAGIAVVNLRPRLRPKAAAFSAAEVQQPSSLVK